MDRIGDYLSLENSKIYGGWVWYDRNGEYRIGVEIGVSEYYFYRDRLSEDGSEIYLRCSKGRKGRKYTQSERS